MAMRGSVGDANAVADGVVLDLFTTLNPQVATRGLVVFDLPSGHYLVKLSGGYESDATAYVNLGNSASSTAPQ